MKIVLKTKAMCLLVFSIGLTAIKAAPEINNRTGAANIAPGEAKLQGRLDGGADADVLVYYGPVDGGMSADAWAEKIELKGVKNTTEFSATAGKLVFGKIYEKDVIEPRGSVVFVLLLFAS